MLAALRSFLRTLVRPGGSAREMRAELEWHVAERTDDLVRHGLSTGEAVRQARRELGDPAKWIDEGREARGLRLVDELWADLRFGARGLRRSPVFALSAILSIGLGIGANAAIFNLIEVVLLQSLPVPAADRLTVYATTEPSGESGRYFSSRAFRALQEHTTVADTTALAPLSMTLAAGTDAADPTITGYMVAGNFFEVLGVSLLRGRSLQTSDDHPSGPAAVVVLSYACWQRRFDGNEGALGSLAHFNGVPLTVVGITAEGFVGTDFARPADVFVPLALQPLLMAEEGRGRVSGAGIDDLWLVLMGRLKAAVTVPRAESEMQPIFARAMLEIPGPAPDADRPPQLRMEAGRAGLSDLRQQLARPLLLLMAAVALVLIIACANVANLLLARAGARGREMALRVSLGAGRGRLVRQLLTESLLLAMLGGGVGLLLAAWGGRILPRLLDLEHVPPLGASPGLTVLGFTILVSIGTAVLFGLAPALTTSQTKASAGSGLSAREATAHGGGRFGGRNALVAFQVALSVILLVGAGLFMRTLTNLGRVDLGFDRARVLTLRLEPRGSNQKSQNEARLRRIYGLLLQGVERLPGVRAVSLAGTTPLSDGNVVMPRIVIADAVPGAQAQPTRMMQVYPNYLQAAGIPLLAGRDLTSADDTPDAPPVAVVNDTLAARFGGRGRAVGRLFSLGPGGASFEIVGVAGDVRDRSLREVPAPVAYATFAKTPTGRGQMTLIVRTTIEPSQLSTAVQRLAASVDPTMPRARLETIEDRVAAASREERMLATLAGVFGAVALALAALGVYGVLAYSVARRRVEFGIRLALGLTPQRLRRSIVGESCAVVIVGLLIGTAAAVALAHALSAWLFGVAPIDPLTIGVVCAALMTVAVLAAWVPARWAARVDPARTLRL